MRQATKVAIFASGEINESFALSQMAPLMARMDRCLTSLQRYWNIDAAGGVTLRTRAVGNAAQYFADGDYPEAAAREGAVGVVGFALLIDESGKVVDCTLTETSNVAMLDAETCAVLTARAKFTPAIGADGKPAKDAFAGRISWRLP